MATICYAWEDAPYAWIDTPFTWAEGCVIEKLITGVGGAISSQKIRERLDELPEDEKEKDRVVARALLQAIVGGTPA